MPRRRGTAKVFWSGRSQAIRLPKEFRVSAREVRVERDGDKLILEPVETPVDANGWPVGFWERVATASHDFDVGERPRTHERKDPLGDD